MAAFADALDLRIAVAENVGDTSLTDLFPRFVQMAEAKLNKRLRTNAQITDATLTFTEGEADLPDDFAEIIHVYDPHGCIMRGGTIAYTKRPGSVYSRYAIKGAKMLIHGISGDRNIVYYAQLPTLTSAVTATNWLLQEAPDVYLYAVSLEAAKHLKNVDMARALSDLLRDAVRDLERDSFSQRWANTTVKPMMVTP